MRTVFTAQHPAQAHLVAGLLEEEGIRCVIEGEMLFGARGDIGMGSSTLPKVCVGEADVARAADIVAGHEVRLAQARESEDESEAPPRRWTGRAAFIVGLWVVIAAAMAPFGPIGVAIALPVCAVGLYVHLLHQFGQGS